MIKVGFTSCIVVLSSALLIGLGVFTQHPVSTQRSVTTPKGHVTVLALDMSGSMDQTDHPKIRCSAANAYIDLAGPGDFIGAIDLGGDHASVLSAPLDMSTLPQRQKLQQAIRSGTNDCAPNGNTPTLDALNQSYQMLQSATNTKNGQLSGSVILLTDGQPEPDSQGQINTIEQTTLSQFSKAQWPIDTIALGEDNGLHQFISDIANGTHGKAYADDNGVVSGVSSLNVLPFIIDIFARRSGRVLGATIAPTAINGGTSRDFQVGNYVDHLDLVVMKDTPEATVSVTTPNGQTLPPAVAGTFVASGDPYYSIFSIDGPQAGTWQVNAAGSGNFLVSSLILSSLKVSIIAPDATDLPIGQQFVIQATISSHGTPLTGTQFTVTGLVQYAGIDKVPFSLGVTLTDSQSAGIYVANALVPANAQVGAYSISVSISQVSATPISSDSRILNFEHFPQPYLLLPTGQRTDAQVTSTVINYDNVLGFLYSAPSGFMHWLSYWPLKGRPVRGNANIVGQIFLDDAPYCLAKVTGTATNEKTKTTVPSTIVNTGCGRFNVQFAAPIAGTYDLAFDTKGAFKETHGHLASVTRITKLTIQPASVNDEVFAWAYTIGFLFALIFLCLFIRYWSLPAPVGSYKIGGEPHDFNTNRNPLRAFLQRNYLPTPFKKKRGIHMLVKRDFLALLTGKGKKRIYLVRQDKKAGPWFDLSDSAVPAKLAEKTGVKYKDAQGTETFTFETREKAERRHAGGGLSNGRGSKKPVSVGATYSRQESRSSGVQGLSGPNSTKSTKKKR